MNIPFFRLLVTLIILFGSVSGQAAIRTDLQDATLVAVVQDHLFLQQSVSLVYQVAKSGKQSISPRVFMLSAIEDYLLARHGEKVVGREVLMKPVAVGYPVDAYIEGRIASYYLQAYGRKVEQQLTEKLGAADAKQLAYTKWDRATLEPMLSQGQVLGAELSDDQVAKAKNMVVAHYQFPGWSEKPITLYELYRRQNIQGKIRFHQLDTDYIKAMAEQYSRTQAIFWWADQIEKIPAAVRTQLKEITEDRFLARRVRQHYGLGRDMHDENPVLDEAYQAVSKDEIHAYYQAHKKEFERIEQVQARHILLPDEATAKAAHRDLIGGMSFRDAVSKYSIAPDKSENPDGHLPLIQEGDSTRAWLKSIVFALKADKTSRPIRAPQKDGSVKWEIFLVDQVGKGYYAPDGETVRYLAGKAIALAKLETRFETLRKDLIGNTAIRLNEVVIDKLAAQPAL